MKTLAPKLFILVFAITFFSCSSDNPIDLFAEDEVTLEAEAAAEAAAAEAAAAEAAAAEAAAAEAAAAEAAAAEAAAAEAAAAEAAAAEAAAAEAAAAAAGSYTYSEIESEISALINSHRKSIGLNALTTLDVISELADGHSNYMVSTGTLSHDNFSERAQKLISEANATSVGENVAYGQRTAQEVVNGWLGSSGHKGVIEESKFTHFGVSVETDSNGRNYFTQIFIAK